MKNKIIFALVLVLTVAAGCNDASYDIIDNGLYLKEAQDAKGLMSRKITVDDQSVELTLTPALSAPMDADVWVTFSLDAEILTAYNQANESDYELLPSSLYQMGEGVTIHAGSVSGDAVRVVVEPFQAEDGVMYALPITVSSTQVNALPTSSKYIILLDKPLIQSVPYIEYRSHLLCEQLNTDGTMKGDWGLSLNEWSLEFWVWMDGFAKNNQALFDSEDIYIRFGDAMIDFDLIQIKTRDTQVNSVAHFSPNTWTHVAFTYNAAGLLTLYINGVNDVTLQTKGGAVPVNYLQMVSSGYDYFKNNCQMAQVRFWSRCITETQINANMYYSIKPSDDMIGYWRMDEGQGDICYDCTPNERHAHASYPLTWNHDVRFDGN